MQKINSVWGLLELVHQRAQERGKPTGVVGQRPGQPARKAQPLKRIEQLGRRAEAAGEDGPGPTDLAIYDLAGRRITTLLSGPQSAGEKTVVWDGNDTGGREVPSGIYFCRLEAGHQHLTRRMLLLR